MVYQTVINKERMFEIFSTLAANQEDDSIRQQAELISTDILSEIAELRLRRRRASRSDIRTTIDNAGLSAPPLELATFDKVVGVIQGIVTAMTCAVQETWATDIDPALEKTLDGLLQVSPGVDAFPIRDEDRDALVARITRENTNLFSALKCLLRELESAVDLFLSYAEATASEDVVTAAQAKAEQYVRCISDIRDRLTLMMTD